LLFQFIKRRFVTPTPTAHWVMHVVKLYIHFNFLTYKIN